MNKASPLSYPFAPSFSESSASVSLKSIMLSLIALFFMGFALTAHAAPTQQEIATGLKGLLNQATKKSIAELSQSEAFSKNPTIKIDLPGNLKTVSSLLKKVGLGEQLSQLEKGMNNAAEAAIPEAQQMLLNSIQQMTFKDAKAILTGGDTAATAYLEKTNRAQLFNKFLPKVKSVTDKNALAGNYNALVRRASVFGATNNLSIENYVANKALDGLFKTMAEQERYVRNHPAEAATGVAKKILQWL